MPSKIYAISRYQFGNRESNQELAVADLVAELNSANDTFQAVIAECIANASNVDYAPINMHRCREIVNKCGKLLCGKGPNEQQYRDDTIKECVEMVSANNAVITLAKDFNVIKSMRAWAAEVDDRYSGITISKLLVDSPPVCSICDQTVIYETMTDHVRSPECHGEAMYNQEIQNGWTQLTEDDEIKVVFEATKIKSKLAPTSYGLFVPSWVKTAIETFNDSNGFGGMTLAEFLDKMADSNSPPTK